MGVPECDAAASLSGLLDLTDAMVRSVRGTSLSVGVSAGQGILPDCRRIRLGEKQPDKN